LGREADRDGTFVLTKVPAGIRSLHVYYTGLLPFDTSVEIAGEQIAKVNVILNQHVVELQAFTVSVSREGEAASITKQRNADNVMNVVGMEAFGRVADGNIGNFLIRLPGVAGDMENGEVTGIIIRGMPPALNSVNIDGVRAADALAGFNSMGDRAAQIDHIPAEFIKEIEVNKAPLPENPVDSLGSGVNLVTKSALDFDRSVLSYRAGVNHNMLRSDLPQFTPNAALSYLSRIGPKRSIGVAFSASYSDSVSQRCCPALSWRPPRCRRCLTSPAPAAIPPRSIFTTLPTLLGEWAIVSHGNTPWPFRNHNYLAWFEGRYWAMWSHGLRQEDFPEQHVQYATSVDGLTWTESKPIVGPSSDRDFRYIARGFWVHDGRLLAIASHDESYDSSGKKKLFGPSLELRVYRWDSVAERWFPHGVMAKDTINNFPPAKLGDGNWAMTRRDHNMKVSMLIGGATSPHEWSNIPLMMPPGAGFSADEPVLSILPDQRVLGLFRDNSHSKRLYCAVSADHGHSWTMPEKTNFPDASSKFFVLRTTRGYYVLVSNANPAPEQRIPLCLSVSEDGLTYTRMARLPVPSAAQDFRPRIGIRKAAGFQYPHAIEHEGHVQIIYSRDMKTVETLRIPLDKVDRLRRTNLSDTAR
jgi:hypothetical protein